MKKLRKRKLIGKGEETRKRIITWFNNWKIIIKRAKRKKKKEKKTNMNNCQIQNKIKLKK